MPLWDTVLGLNIWASAYRPIDARSVIPKHEAWVESKTESEKSHGQTSKVLKFKPNPSFAMSSLSVQHRNMDESLLVQRFEDLPSSSEFESLIESRNVPAVQFSFPRNFTYYTSYSLFLSRENNIRFLLLSLIVFN